jgi:hypothetical protein
VPPRTESSTSPGPPGGMETVTRPVYTRQAPGRRAVPGRLREASSSLEKPA